MSMNLICFANGRAKLASKRRAEVILYSSTVPSD